MIWVRSLQNVFSLQNLWRNTTLYVKAWPVARLLRTLFTIVIIITINALQFSQKHTKYTYQCARKWCWHTRAFIHFGDRQPSHRWFNVKPLIWGGPNPKTDMFLVSSCSCPCPIYWGQVLSQEWGCNRSSANRRSPNFIWVINNLLPTKVRLILDVWWYFVFWIENKDENSRIASDRRRT